MASGGFGLAGRFASYGAFVELRGHGAFQGDVGLGSTGSWTLTAGLVL
jgi:hypothetical protein